MQIPDRTVRRVIGALRWSAANLLESLSLAPMRGAIGHRGPSNIECACDSRIGNPFIEQRMHSSLERFAKAGRMLAQVFDRFRLQERGRCASRRRMSPFEKAIYAGQLSGLGFALVGPP